MANYTRQRRKNGRGGQVEAAQQPQSQGEQEHLHRPLGNRRTVTDVYDDIPF